MAADSPDCVARPLVCLFSTVSLAVHRWAWQRCSHSSSTSWSRLTHNLPDTALPAVRLCDAVCADIAVTFLLAACRCCCIGLLSRSSLTPSGPIPS